MQSATPMQRTVESSLSTLPSVLPMPEYMWSHRPIIHDLLFDDQRVDLDIDGTGLSLERFEGWKVHPLGPLQWNLYIRFYGRPNGYATPICLQEKMYIFPQGKPDIQFTVHNRLNPRALKEITYYSILQKDENTHQLLRITSYGEPLFPNGMPVRDYSSEDFSMDEPSDLEEVDNNFQNLSMHDSSAHDDHGILDDRVVHMHELRRRESLERIPPLLRDE